MIFKNCNKGIVKKLTLANSHSMRKQKRITDRNALKKNRARAISSKNSYFYLHETAVEEIVERLREINREFNKIAIVTGYPEIWRAKFPKADILSDSDILKFNGDEYELIIHGMTLHWSDDPVGQLIQCKNKLIADGLFLCVLFGGKTLHELKYSLSKAEIEISGGISPRFMPMGEIRDLGDLLQRTGFALPVADSILKNFSYKKIRELIYDIRKMGETNVLLSRKKTFTRSKIMDDMVKIYSNKFKEKDGTFTATFELIFLTGWAPSENQQKPLKPGSAQVSLAKLLDDFPK